ncbi:MAG: VOC family protein [Chloroflexi bacterium]|jgi:methylmalonyl-CoA/ethylmalonyl-CoA epimerase|nr:VOC family protein [Chloroflexota bacterium]
MTNQEFKLTEIGQIAIPVHDLERAIEFYQHKLGLNHLFSVPKLAFFECGGIRLMLSVPEKAEFDHPSSILYFKVPDIQIAYTSLSARGVQFEDTPHLVAQIENHDLWLAFFRGSESNLLSLMSEVNRT